MLLVSERLKAWQKDGTKMVAGSPSDFDDSTDGNTTEEDVVATGPPSSAATGVCT